MRRANIKRVALILAACVAVGTAVGVADTVPSARAPSEKLTLWDKEVYEGRRVLRDEDSYPRRPGKLVEGPTVTQQGGQIAIGFALDRADDVLVRIVDADGNTVRNLACGVLGGNAPEPFKSDTLKQQITWDGNDAEGKPAPPRCKVRVAVGLRPRLDRFVAHDPKQLQPYICGLEIDDQGRVYVALFTDRRGDPQVVRYDREGNFLDTVYPPNPNLLKGKLDDVYGYCDHVDGKAVPMRFGGAWPFIIYKYHSGQEKDPTRYTLPLRISPDGRAYMAETMIATYHSQMTPSEYKAVGPIGARLFPIRLDPFWFLQGMTMGRGPWAIGGEGTAYLCKQNQLILKVSLKDLKPLPDFQYNGGRRLDEKQASLGSTKKRDGEASLFKMITDLTVDGQGNLYVVDAGLLKVFRPNGQSVGTVDQFTLDGRTQPLGTARGVRAVAGNLYVVARDKTAKTGTPTARLVKYRLGDDARPRAVWALPLDGMASLVAVDRYVVPPVVWVGNGGGPATFSRIVDKGTGPGKVRHHGGGIKKNVLLDPWAIALDGRGRIFVHDYARGAIVRTNDDGSQWLESPRLGTKSLHIDRRRGRLFVSQSNRLFCCDLDLNEDKAAKFPKPTGRGGVNLGAVDAQGNLYVSDLKQGSPQRNTKPDLHGLIRQHAPDGSVKNEVVCRTYLADGGLDIDSKGCIYLTDTCRMGFMDAVHNWSVAREPKWRRGDKAIRAQSDLAYVVKFPPSGGTRGTDTELWAHRGASPVMGGGCRCPVASNCLAIDAADRIFAADFTKYHVRVLDTAGNLIARIGAWGNADCRGPSSKYPQPEIAFGWVHSLDTFNDALYASDKDLRRIAKVRMDYRQTKEVALP